MATSGIAALLLPGGTTAHSRFGIPVQLGGTSSLPIEGERAGIIRDAAVIIWDEAPMGHKDSYRVLDLFLRDIMATVDPSLHGVPFGGKVVVMAGDWRQILPVVRRGTRSQVVGATLKSSYLWPSFKIFELRKNLRVHLASQNASGVVGADFAEWLLNVGEGNTPNPWPIPPSMVVPGSDVLDLVKTVYPPNVCHDLENRCILTVRNNFTDDINDTVLQQVRGEEHTYESADYFGQDAGEEANIYPTEFLNTLQPNGMPRHTIKLKVGVPIILLRNLSRSAGLMNGTRLVVTA